MTRSLLPFYAGDISELARSLHKQLAASGHAPGHLELLNMLARAAGSRNFQHFRAKMVAEKRLMRPGEVPAPIDYVELQKLSRYFDVADGYAGPPSSATRIGVSGCCGPRFRRVKRFRKNRSTSYCSRIICSMIPRCFDGK